MTVLSGRNRPSGFPDAHPERNPYIAVHDLAKVGDLQRVFADLYRAFPVLVLGAQSSQ